MGGSCRPRGEMHHLQFADLPLHNCFSNAQVVGVKTTTKADQDGYVRLIRFLYHSFYPAYVQIWSYLV